MRLSVALILAALVAPTFATGASSEEARESISVTTMRLASEDVHVAWTPEPGALSYDLYRGATLETLEFVATTTGLSYTDLSAPAEEVWYEVVSRTSHMDESPSRGRCIAMRSTGIAVTLAHCMPAEGPAFLTPGL